MDLTVALLPISRYGGGPAYPRKVISIGQQKLLRIGTALSLLVRVAFLRLMALLRTELYPYYITFVRSDDVGVPGKHESVH
jgi:hypothetical protein